VDICTVVSVGSATANSVVLAPVFLELVGIACGQRDAVEYHVCPETKQVGVGIGNRRFECIVRHCVSAVQVTGQERNGVIQAVLPSDVNGKGLTPVFGGRLWLPEWSLVQYNF